MPIQKPDRVTALGKRVKLRLWKKKKDRLLQSACAILGFWRRRPAGRTLSLAAPRRGIAALALSGLAQDSITQLDDVVDKHLSRPEP